MPLIVKEYLVFVLVTSLIEVFIKPLFILASWKQFKKFSFDIPELSHKISSSISLFYLITLRIIINLSSKDCII